MTAHIPAALRHAAVGAAALLAAALASLTATDTPLKRALWAAGALAAAIAGGLHTAHQAVGEDDDQPADEPAGHDDGPSVAECAKDDARWFGGEKDGE